MFFQKFFFVLHILVVLFGFLGCFLPKKYLIYHLLLWPIILIQWLLNKNKCVISQAEKFATESKDNKIKYKHFSTRLFNMIGLDFDENKKEDRMKIKNLNVILFSISWLVSLYRLIY